MKRPHRRRRRGWSELALEAVELADRVREQAANPGESLPGFPLPLVELLDDGESDTAREVVLPFPLRTIALGPHLPA